MDFSVSSSAGRLVNFIRTPTKTLEFTFNALMDFDELYQDFKRAVGVQLFLATEAVRELSITRVVTQSISATFNSDRWISISRSVGLSIELTANAATDFIQFIWGLLDVNVQSFVGDAIENAMVQVWDENSTIISGSFTNSTGYVPTQNLTRGNYTIMVIGGDYMPKIDSFVFVKTQLIKIVLLTVEESTMIVNEFDAASLAIMSLGVIFTVIYFLRDKQWQTGVIAVGAWTISSMTTLAHNIEAWPQATFLIGLAMTIVFLMMMDAAGARSRDFWE